jgi:hypothetical protein
MTLDKYRLFCVTENCNVETDYRESVPTVCPNNNSHTIDTDSITVIASQTTENPRDKTGKERMQETCRPLGHDTYFTGQGDDVSDVTKTGDGHDNDQMFCIDHIADLDITYVARAANVAPIKVATAHGLRVGDKVDVDCNDDNYNAEIAVILSVPDSTTLTFSNTGDDENEKAATGHVVGRVHYLYLDFNIIANRTWLHEGYITWKDALFDSVSLEIVPIVTPILTGQTGKYFNLYGGYLVVPAAGDGTIDVASDITDPRGGLIYMPNDDQDNPPVAFWNADWDSSTKKFKNITAAPLGNGRYNMFAVEVALNRFVNRVPLLYNGFQMLQSADSAELGQGMRLKATAQTWGADHVWKCACALTMHRAKTV